MSVSLKAKPARCLKRLVVAIFNFNGFYILAHLKADQNWTQEIVVGTLPASACSNFFSFDLL